jgi:hypothetical protein
LTNTAEKLMQAAPAATLNAAKRGAAGLLSKLGIISSKGKGAAVVGRHSVIHFPISAATSRGMPWPPSKLR